jgi:hypothetical protein
MVLHHLAGIGAFEKDRGHVSSMQPDNVREIDPPQIP